MKRCCRCGETKATSEFHRRAAARDGLNPACKGCICAERRQYTLDNADKLQAYRRGRQVDDDYRESRKMAARAWREANKEHQAAYARRYQQENAAFVAALKHAWYQANREVVLARQREDVEGSRAKNARYRESHREEWTEAQRRRRALELGANVSETDLEALWTGTCPLCDEPMDRELRYPDPMSKSLDHITPLALGGDHAMGNLQWAHLRCNVAKGARMPELKRVS